MYMQDDFLWTTMSSSISMIHIQPAGFIFYDVVENQRGIILLNRITFALVTVELNVDFGAFKS